MKITRRQLQVLASRGTVTLFAQKPSSVGVSAAVSTNNSAVDPDTAFYADIVECRPMYAADVTAEDAAAGGYKNLEELAGDLLAGRGLGWVAGFAFKTLVAEIGAETVFKVTLRHSDERPRLLAGFGRSGYTTSPAMAMPGEPEAVGLVELTGYGDTAHQARVAEKARLEAELDALPLNQRLDRAFQEARDAGLDTSFQEHSILKRIQSLESRIRRSRSAVA